MSVPIRLLILYISASVLDPSRAPKAEQAGDREREREREKHLGEKVRARAWGRRNRRPNKKEKAPGPLWPQNEY